MEIAFVDLTDARGEAAAGPRTAEVTRAPAGGRPQDPAPARDRPPRGVAA